MNELSPRDEHAHVMRRLAAFGLMKDIIRLYTTMKPDELNYYFNAYEPPSHRGGQKWYRKKYSQHLGDRVVRVYENVVGDNCDPRRLTPKQLLDVTVAYLSIYERDDVSVNRIYHLIMNIKAGVVAVEKSCAKCKKPYIVQRSIYCASCNTIKTTSRSKRSNDKTFERISRDSVLPNNLFVNNTENASSLSA